MTAPNYPKDWPKSVWTPEEWHHAMLGRLNPWVTLPNPRPHLLQYMHMSVSGYMYWRDNHIVPRETRILYTIFPEFLDE